MYFQNYSSSGIDFCVWYAIEVILFLVFHMDIHCIQYHFLKSTLSPLYCNGSLGPSRACFWLLFHWSVCASTRGSFTVYMSYMIHVCHICPLFQNYLGLFLAPWIFHKFRNQPSVSKNKPIHLIWDCIESLHQFGENWNTFSIASSSQCIWSLSLHLFSSSISQQCV